MWTQPVLTANGTIGVDEFAVESGGGANSDAYKAFDSSASSYVNKMNTDAWLSFYSEAWLTISDIVITSGGSLPALGIFQVSYDGGETWTQCGAWEDTDALGKSAHVVIDEGTVTGGYFRFVSQGRSLAKPNNNADFYNVVITADIADRFPVTHTADFELITRNKPNIEVDACYMFDGTNSSRATLPLEVLAGATEFTIEIKFATTSTGNKTNNYDWDALIGRNFASYWHNETVLCVNDGKLCFWTEPQNNGSSETSNTLTDVVVNDGAIHTAAVRSNADGSIDLFCDGEHIAHTDNVNAKIPDTYEINIAYNGYNSASRLPMDFYEARLWSVARDEIFADIDGSEDGLEAWYLPTPTGIVDYSTHFRNAAVYGATYAWHVADTADIERVLAVFHITETADLERVIHVHTTETADLERITATHATATVDLERVVINHVDTTADLERVVINRVDETADLERITATHATATGDIERIVFTRVNETGDLERVVIARVDETADLERITATHATDNADLERVVITRVEKTADLERVLRIRATETADLERITATHSAATADLERVVNARITETADLERVLIGVQPTLPKLAFSVRHLGEIINAPLKYSATPIAPALTVRWLGCDWYNPLVLPYDENATPILINFGGNYYALSATIP